MSSQQRYLLVGGIYDGRWTDPMGEQPFVLVPGRGGVQFRYVREWQKQGLFKGRWVYRYERPE